MSRSFWSAANEGMTPRERREYNRWLMDVRERMRQIRELMPDDLERPQGVQLSAAQLPALRIQMDKLRALVDQAPYFAGKEKAK